MPSQPFPDQLAHHFGDGRLFLIGQPLLELRGHPYGQLNVGRPIHGIAKDRTTTPFTGTTLRMSR